MSIPTPLPQQTPLALAISARFEPIQRLDWLFCTAPDLIRHRIVNLQ